MRLPGTLVGAVAGTGAPARALGGLRVLEIGDVAMFKQGMPASTELVWTGHRDDVEGVDRPAGFHPRHLPALRRSLDRAEYDVVVGHPPQHPPWDLRRAAHLLRRYGRGAPARILRGWGIRLLLRPSRTPLAMLDLADRDVIWRHNLPLLARARVYFKRELLADRGKVFPRAVPRELPGRRPRTPSSLAAWCAKLEPISLAVSPCRAAEIAAAMAAHPEKTVDIFFAGRVEGSSPVRTAGLSELRALGREGFRIDIAPDRLDRPEFYRRCARAWITWSPEGHGWDCFRHYEAPLCESVPLMNQPSIVRHAPLHAGAHALFYQVETGDLARTACAALADRAALARMAAAAREHVRRFHTLERLCAHVVRRCLAGERLPPAGADDHG